MMLNGSTEALQIIKYVEGTLDGNLDILAKYSLLLLVANNRAVIDFVSFMNFGHVKNFFSSGLYTFM